MILLGLLLMVGAIALSAAAIWANEDAFSSSAGQFELLGYSADLTVSQVYIAGLIVGALGFFGIMMMMSGAGRRATRRAATRRQLREQEDQLREQESQLRDLQREREAQSAEASADARHHRAEDAEAVRHDNNRNEDIRHDNLANR